MSIPSVQEAIQLLSQHCKTPAPVRVSLEESLGHVLAIPIMAPMPIPHFDKSPYDGYAICCPKEGAQHHEFMVKGRIGAGERYPHPLQNGEAVRIMTGAPIPKGADTVAMLEQCAVLADDGTATPAMDARTGQETRIVVKGELFPKDNIIHRGEECAEGTSLVMAGTKIHGGTIALLASLGYTSVSVYPRPRIAILTSGHELQAIDQPLTDHTIYNSNGPMLRALLAEKGFAASISYHVSDRPEAIEEEIQILREKLATIDIVISTGGVSVGDFDFMPYIYEQLGATPLYHRVAMRPGAAQYAGYSSTTLFLGLSGNPSAAYNGLQLIGFPLLRKLSGETSTSSLRLRCRMGETLRKRNPFDRYIQGVLKEVDGVTTFYPASVFTSNAILGLASANALYCMPRNHNETCLGDDIEVLVL